MSPKPTPTAARLKLDIALALVKAQATGSFPAVEKIFLDAMWDFDQLVAQGVATSGDINNGKGDFFNDIIST